MLNIFKRKAKYGIILKSGYEIKFRADVVEWKWNSGTTAFESYKIDGIEDCKPCHIDVNEIAAIVRYQ